MILLLPSDRILEIEISDLSYWIIKDIWSYKMILFKNVIIHKDFDIDNKRVIDYLNEQ
jgi:hypothetical protein